LSSRRGTHQDSEETRCLTPLQQKKSVITPVIAVHLGALKQKKAEDITPRGGTIDLWQAEEFVKKEEELSFKENFCRGSSTPRNENVDILSDYIGSD